MAKLKWVVYARRIAMLYFRDYQWLLVQGYSRFKAQISPKARAQDGVHWMLQMRFVAAGAAWRRVLWWERPSFWLCLSGFGAKMKSWKEMEQLDFWNTDDNEVDDELTWGQRGYLDVDFYPQRDAEARETLSVEDCVWRVATREAGRFTVELAGFTESRNKLRDLIKPDVLVTADGQIERRRPDADFWKKQGGFYLLEDVPFGTVTVCVPRNARDPEAYAMARTKSFIGASEPEYVEVRDFSKWKKPSKSLCDDIFVELHFNGYYED